MVIQADFHIKINGKPVFADMTISQTTSFMSLSRWPWRA